MINIKLICPCCKKNIQLILSDMDAENKISVLSIEEMDSENTENQEYLEQKLLETKNIILG